MKTKKALKANNKKQLENLNKWNIGMSILHAVQGIAVLILAGNVTFPLNTSFLTVDTISSTGGTPNLVPATQNIFDINLAFIVATFFFMSSIAHVLVATFWRKQYEKNLKNHINKVRWFEYAFSASTMMVAIAILAGVYDISSLLMLFALTGFMNMMGLIMEITNQKSKKTNWTSFIIGSTAGIIPWIVIGIYFWGTNVYGSGQIPTFVYWIYASLFIFFNCFAVNMYLQYKRVGKWKEYLYGEKVYMVLSLVAKSALAWQVFFGALRP